MSPMTPGDAGALERPRDGAGVAGPALAFLSGIIRSIGSTLDEGEIVRIVMRRSVPFVGDACFLCIRDGGGATRAAPGGDVHESVGAALAERVMEDGVPLRIERMGSEQLSEISGDGIPPDVLRGWGIRSCLAVPLADHKGVFGAVGWTTRARTHSPSDLAVAELLGLQISTAINHARVLEAATAEMRRREGSEAAFRESEKRFRGLVEHAGDAVFVHEVDGPLLMVNHAACESLGYSREELLDMDIGDLVTSRARERVPDYKERLARGERVTVEGVHHRKDGTSFPVDVALAMVEWKGRPAMIALAHDVTERERAARALQENEERFRALLEHSTDAVAVLDTEGNFTYHSASSRWMLGYEPEEMIGRSGFEFMHPDDQGQAAAELETLARNPDAVVRLDYRFRHADGHWMEMEATGRNALEHPAIRGFIVNYRDVTDRRRLEEHMHQAQRLEAVGQLAGGIAHDFNNLLTAIRLISHLWSSDAPPEDGLRRDMEEIERVAERGTALTGQLLAFSRKQVLSLEKTRLDRVVEDMRDMLRRLIGEHIELLIETEPVWVLAEPIQLEQVLMNLVVNARDAVGQGGRVTITVGPIDPPDPPDEQPDDPGEWAALTVVDDGVGMSPEVAERVFEPFFTTKPRGKGTGLGLATVYGIVKQSGGDVRVESQPDAGARFVILLPRIEPGEEADVSEKEAAAAAAGTEQILLVEDDEAIRRVCERVLVRYGYRVHTAGDAEEALRLYDADGVIDLVVTDVVLPGLSGPRLAAELRERGADLPVLFMSGYAGEELELHGSFEPGEDYLAKPFTPPELLKKIRTLLDAPRD